MRRSSLASAIVTATAATLLLAGFTGCSKTDSGSRQPASQSSSALGPGAPPSPFEGLWATASTRDNYRPYLALKASRTAYCAHLVENSESCGDQFEPDKQYRKDAEDAKLIRDSIWRTEVTEGFGNIAFRGNIGPGPFDVKRSTISLNITWPIELGRASNRIEAAKHRLPVVDSVLWKETQEQLADFTFTDGAIAREWRAQYRTARFVFKLTDSVMGPPRPLLIIKVLGMQIRGPDGTVLRESVPGVPEGDAGPPSRK